MIRNHDDFRNVEVKFSVVFKIQNLKFYVGGITKWWTPPVQLLLTTPITLIKMRHEPVVLIESQQQTKQMLCGCEM